MGVPHMQVTKSRIRLFFVTAATSVVSVAAFVGISGAPGPAKAEPTPVSVSVQPGGPDRITRMSAGAQVKSLAPSMVGAPYLRITADGTPEYESVTRVSDWVFGECGDGPQRCETALAYAGWALAPWGYSVYETGEIVSRDGAQVWTPAGL